jgi:hypothetical protein
MLNKNDPLVSAIQDVMRKNQAERDAVKAVNEKFGVQDRRVLPREKQSEWDAAYQTVLSEGVESLDEAKKKSKSLHPGLNNPEAAQIRKIAGPGKVQYDPDTGVHIHDDMNDSVRKIRGFKAKDGKVKEIKGFKPGMYEEVDDEKSDIDHPNKRILDVAKPFGNLTSADFRKLRSMEEEGDPNKRIPGDTVTGSGTVTPVKAKPRPTSITPDQQKALSDKIETIKEAKKAAMYEGGMKKTMGEFKRGTLHSGSKTGPIVKSREQAIAIGMNNEETVNRAGKGDFPAQLKYPPSSGQSQYSQTGSAGGLPTPQTVAPGKGNLKEPLTRSMTVDKPETEKSSAPPAVSTTTRDKPPAPESSSSTQTMQRGAEQDKVGMKRPSAVAPAAAKPPIGTNAAGQQVGAPPAAKPPIPRLRPANDTVKKAASNVKPAAQKLKAVRKQPPVSAATRPVNKYSRINNMRQQRRSDKNNDPAGPGNS